MTAAATPDGPSLPPPSADRAAASAGLRRTPQQARSRDRVRRILAAADALLGEEGYEALAIRRIAERAEVPVGSIYQFFPDKAAIVEALGRHYIEGFGGAITALVARAAHERWEDPVGVAVDTFAALYRGNPGYLALWTGRHLSPELARADEANNAAIAEGVRRILLLQYGLPDDPGTERAARFAVWATDAVLQHAFRGGTAGDPEMLAELKHVLRLYAADLRDRPRG